MTSITNNPPGQRELVYCHICNEEWYRDEHGLVCPTCGGDFVEIIENNNDPRAPPTAPNRELPEDFDIDSDDGASAARDHSHPAATFIRVEGPNFSFTSTQRTFRPRTQLRSNMATGDLSGESGHDSPEDMMMLFTNMLRNIVGDHNYGSPGGTPGSTNQSPRSEGGPGQTPGGPSSLHSHTHTHTPLPPFFGAPPPVFPGTRWHYDASARLNPRDADSPQPHDETVIDLSTLLATVFGPGSGDSGGIFARVLGMPPGAGGDYVYSQADLDRVISQLMEQHQGNAPPPASKDTIDKLPKIKVTEQMVRDEVDCAVCKEDLIIEEEVAKLPCNHIYHFECVKRWLEAHDTCPICRHPVTPEDQRPQPQSPGSRPHTTPWQFPSMPQRSQPPGPSPAPDQGGGTASGSSGNSNRHSWSGLFRRRDNDRA